MMPARRTAVLAAAVLLMSSASVVDADAGTAYSPPAPRPAVIAAGFHTVAVTPSGTVRAWGDNASGEVGTGAASGAVSTPVTVLGFAGSAPLRHVVQVAAGRYSSYALLADGTVAAWGENSAGQLGDGALTDSGRPVHVVSTSGKGVLRGVISISAGALGAYAVLANHTVAAWGDGTKGGLGNGRLTNAPVPVLVHGENSSVLTGIVAVTGGFDSAYALTSAGTGYAWGDDIAGALGDNDPSHTNQPTPVQLAGVGGNGRLRHIVGLAGGTFWAMALLSDGSVVSWGNNAYGDLGNGSTDDSIVPEPVRDLGNHVARIAAGPISDDGFAVNANGAVFGWGDNFSGEVGDGSTVQRNSPVALTRFGAGSGVVQLAGGSPSTAAVTAAGAVYDWGDNGYGQLGDGTSVSSPAPTQPYKPGRIGLPKLFLLKAPVLGGTAKTGHTLSVTAGTWGLPATVHSYQWLRGGKVIKGATKSRYKLAAADRKHHISVRVGASRAGYPGNSTTTRAVAVPR